MTNLSTGGPFLIGTATQVITLHPKHIVMCVGNGRPNIPQFKHVDKFKGSLYHSDQHKNVKQWEGKKAVVVGAVSIYPTAVGRSLNILICSALTL